MDVKETNKSYPRAAFEFCSSEKNAASRQDDSSGLQYSETCLKKLPGGGGGAIKIPREQ